MARCTAKSKQSGEQCLRNAAKGKDVCHMHGAKSLSGAASGRFKTGRYSESMKKTSRILNHYEKALLDEDPLNQRDEIALTEARVATLLERLEHGDLGSRWLELQNHYETILAATKKQDLGAGQTAFEQIGNLINAGADDYDVWKQINEALEQRRRLVDTERKRLVDMQQTITAEQGVVLIYALLSIITEEVQDPYVLARLQTRITGLLSVGTGEGVSA